MTSPDATEFLPWGFDLLALQAAGELTNRTYYP